VADEMAQVMPGTNVVRGRLEGPGTELLEECDRDRASYRERRHCRVGCS
jgi:hypothetical protein